GVTRHRVEEVVVLLHVLPVVPLAVGEPEEPLLEDRVAAVPQRESEAEELLVVRKPCQAVLPPAVGAAPGMVVREVVPRRAAGAVVLAHGAPLPFREVGTPAPPRRP